ncbi:hypothetical protein BDB00DRAFT_878597 [Zychaea mexicana]|uniref:uncharacterized protein n=1 Tax=Zychaea mexicana TaxID=64656 RepID=UPI0022FF2D7F|nr:uncharacterized protein BDB00DRAFT_878597 [Zychaea mexicana]KAI9484633.1 hypothetical protein BDB00DRAFT_878597 [Zychaea mexicana]
MIPAEEQDLVLEVNPPKDWIDSMELSDTAKEILQDAHFPADLKQVLYVRLSRQRDISLQEYEQSLLSDNSSGSPSDLSTRIPTKSQLECNPITIYAPATSPTQQRQFFTSLYNSTIFNQQHPYPERLILSGDFNFSHQCSGYHLNALSAWFTMLHQHVINCINHDPQETLQPTFRRVVQNMLKTREVLYVASSWSDHALLSATFNLGPSPTGKGYWRGNPLILASKDFRHQLATQLTAFFARSDSTSIPQQQWEEPKRLLKRQMQEYCWQRINKTTAYPKQLQSKCNWFLWSNPPITTRIWLLKIIEQQILAAQHEVCDTLTLRAGEHWREQVESMHSAVTAFYEQLYTPDDVDDSAIQQLQHNIPSSAHLRTNSKESLIDPFSIEDLQDRAKRAPHQSSPRTDGLPYGII